MSYRTTLTNAGFQLLAECQAGKELHFSRVAMGDGSIQADENIRQMTAMKAEKMTLPILNIEVTGAGTTVMSAALRNDKLEKGFFCREVGIFATNSEGKEILYAYRNTGDESGYIPAGVGAAEVWDLTYDVATVVDQAENVTATIDGGIVYVTRNELQ